MDCVTDEGDVAIVYCGDLNWRGLHVHLSSVLSSDAERLGTRTSVSQYQVNCDGGRISADLPKLAVAGVWESDSGSFERLVFEDKTGSVNWNCIQPRSRATLQIGDRQFSGLGYAECVTLTTLPWELPLSQLRWGRFVSPRDSLAWVDWQGPYVSSFALYNGEERKLLALSDSEVAIPGAALQIEAGLALRSGRLVSTILPGTPELGKLLPRSIFNVEEHKWKSRGLLFNEDHSSSGWVIHEVVKWEV
jgi:hypothetical protein